MTFLDMKAELAQAIPGMSRIYAGTLLNRAWRIIRDASLWSFQLKDGSFSTPDSVFAGTVTVPSLPTPSIIIGDATASAAWAALTFPFITQYQFRISDDCIYNVIAYDTTSNPPFGTLTLDRPFVDPVTTLNNNNYTLAQIYYPAPSPTFKRWLSVQDMIDGYALRIWSSRRDLNILDPQRQITTDPSDILPMGPDTRPGSATLGWPMFEMWPSPNTQISYQTWYVDRGADLAANTDELPEPISSDVVLSKARAYAYEWAEARKDVMAAKGSGSNYAVLKKTAEDDFLARLKTLRLLDRDTVDAYAAKINGANGGAGWGLAPFFNAQTMRSGMGWGWPALWR